MYTSHDKNVKKNMYVWNIFGMYIMLNGPTISFEKNKT